MHYQMRYLRLISAVICLGGTVALWSLYFETHGFRGDPDLFGRIIYLTLGCLSTLLFIQAYKILKELQIARIVQAHIAIFMSAACITGALFFFFKPDYRVLQDEATLTSISYMMSSKATAATLYEARFDRTPPVVLSQGIDKRPPLFPFAVHLFHKVFGYSASHPFIVNALVLFALLSLIGLVFETRFKFWAGLSAQFLVAAQPAVFLSATSAGFDLFSVFFLWVTFLTLDQAIQKRKPDAYVLSGLVLLAYSYTRYESLLIAGLVGIFLISDRSIRNDLMGVYRKRLNWIAAFILLLTPLFWILIHGFREPKLKEVSNAELFSLSQLLNHFSIFLKALLSPPADYPPQGPLFCICLASAVWILLKGPREFLKNKIIRCSALVVSVLLIIALAHFFGDYTNPAALRLFIGFAISASMLPVIALGGLVQKNAKWQGWIAIFPVLAFAVFMVSVSARNSKEIFSRVGATRGYQVSREYLKDKNPKVTVVVSAFPTNFSILGFSSIDFKTFLQNQEQLRISQKSDQFDDIVIFQDVARDSGEPRRGEEIPSTVALTAVKDVALSPQFQLRIFKLEKN